MLFLSRILFRRGQSLGALSKISKGYDCARMCEARASEQEREEEQRERKGEDKDISRARERVQEMSRTPGLWRRESMRLANANCHLSLKDMQSASAETFFFVR